MSARPTSSAALSSTASSTHPTPDQIDTPRIAAFLLIAVAVTTALSIPFATGLLPEEATGLIGPLAQLSPLIAALLVRRRPGRWWKDLGLAIPSWRLLAVAMVAGALAFAVVPLTGAVVGIGLGGPLMTDVPVLSLLVAIPFVLVMQTIFAVGEESGWRGWLHQQLTPLGFWPMSALIGVMWSLWHLPIVLALGLQGREAVTYLVTIAAVAPLLASLRELFGTAWAAVFGHGLFNSLRVAIDQNVLGPFDPALAWGLDALFWVLWLVAAWLVLKLAGRPRPVVRSALVGRPS